MSQFMVVATFKAGTNMQEVFALVEEEKVAVSQIQESGRLGGIRLAVPRGKVFLDVFADDDASAEAVVMKLPMAKFWDLEVYPLSGTA